MVALPNTITVNGKAFTPEQLELADKLGLISIGQKNDPAATTVGQTGHGPFHGSTTQFGLFSGEGVRPGRFSALSRPETLSNILPIVKSEYYQERLDIMTGQLAGGTSNAADFCGDPPQPGDLKIMRRDFLFGKYFIKTELSRIPQTGLLRTRADIPGNILNAGPTANPFIPDIMFNISDARDQLSFNLFKVGVDLGRTMEQVLIQGVASTDNSRTGWWEEFGGIDGQVTTGLTDAATGLAAPAADSAVSSFDADVAGTATDGRNIVEMVSDMWYALNDRAAQVGMAGVQWAIVMRKEAFRRLTDQWACTYAIYQCAGTAAAPNNRDAMAQQALRIEMLQGQHLLIEGDRVPVIFSEGIPQETLANNTYKSDMYFLPISWNGLPLSKIEYFDMSNPYARNLVGFTDHHGMTLNNGMYFVTQRDDGNCIEFLFSAQFRYILETPFLAGRVDDIQFAYLAPTRQAIPGASLYVDGGVSYRS
jgi:hypothetical protein